MSDPKSTGEIRLIAEDVVAKRAEVCTVRRQNLEDKIAANTATVSANAKAINSLTVAMAEQTTKFTSSIDVLTVKLTLGAVVGGSLPVIVVLAWQWLSNRP